MDEYGQNQSKKPAEKFCVRCGTVLNQQDLFCDLCGTRQPERTVVATTPQIASESQMPSEPQTPAPVPKSQVQQLDKPTDAPVTAIILMSVSIVIKVLLLLFKSTSLGLPPIMELLAMFGFWVSLILYKKNLHFVAGIGGVILFLAEFVQLGSTIGSLASRGGIKAIWRNLFLPPQIDLWYMLLIPAACVLLTLGFFYFRTKAGSTLRIVGTLFALVLLTVLLIGDFTNFLTTWGNTRMSFKYWLEYLFITTSGFQSLLCMYLSFLLIKPGKKQA